MLLPTLITHDNTNNTVNERHFGKCITHAHFLGGGGGGGGGHHLPLVYTENLLVRTRTCKLCLTCMRRSPGLGGWDKVSKSCDQRAHFTYSAEVLFKALL